MGVLAALLGAEAASGVAIKRFKALGIPLGEADFLEAKVRKRKVSTWLLESLSIAILYTTAKWLPLAAFLVGLGVAFLTAILAMEDPRDSLLSE